MRQIFLINSSKKKSSFPTTSFVILYVVGIICEHQIGTVPPWVINRGREENNLASWLKRFSQQTEMCQSVAVFFSVPCENVTLPQMREMF